MVSVVVRVVRGKLPSRAIDQFNARQPVVSSSEQMGKRKIPALVSDKIYQKEDFKALE